MFGMNTHDIAQAIGRQNIADALGVRVTAVNNAVGRGRFPPAWFIAMKKLCGEAGIACPVELFAMKGVPSADAPVDRGAA
jgi:hypothetical protein